MISKKENLLEAVVKIIQATIRLEALEKAENESLEAHGLKPEDVERTSYNEAVKELDRLHAEFDKLMENAKHNITAGLTRSEIAVLDNVRRAGDEGDQEFYINEIYFNLAYIVDRARQIKPLFVTQDVPLAMELKYREAVLCCIYGRFDACCAMCRTIAEMMLRELCKDKFKGFAEFAGDSLSTFISMCRKFNFLSGQCLDLVEKIRVKGNSSIHSEALATEEDAIESIDKVQELLRMILRDKRFLARR